VEQQPGRISKAIRHEVERVEPDPGASSMIGQGVSSRSSHSWAAGRTTFSANREPTENLELIFVQLHREVTHRLPRVRDRCHLLGSSDVIDQSLETARPPPETAQPRLPVTARVASPVVRGAKNRRLDIWKPSFEAEPGWTGPTIARPLLSKRSTGSGGLARRTLAAAALLPSERRIRLPGLGEGPVTDIWIDDGDENRHASTVR